MEYLFSGKQSWQHSIEAGYDVPEAVTWSFEKAGKGQVLRKLTLTAYFLREIYEEMREMKRMKRQRSILRPPQRRPCSKVPCKVSALPTHPLRETRIVTEGPYPGPTCCPQSREGDPIYREPQWQRDPYPPAVMSMGEGDPISRQLQWERNPDPLRVI